MSGGTWDATEDAHQALQKGSEAYVICTGLEGLTISRFRTNINTQSGVDWFRSRINLALDQLAEELPPD